MANGKGTRVRRWGVGGGWWGVFFFNDPATTEIYTLSLRDALPIWNVNGVGAVLSRTLIRMTNHSDIRVALNHLHGIVESLALRNARADGTEIDDLATEPLHRRLERHPSAGRILEKQIPKNLACEERCVDFAFCNGEESGGRVKDFNDLGIAQIVHRDQVAHGPPSDESRRGPLIGVARGLGACIPAISINVDGLDSVRIVAQ